jgi:hypothetical protein
MNIHLLAFIIIILFIFSTVYTFDKNNSCHILTHNSSININTIRQLSKFKYEYNQNHIVYIENIFTTNYFKNLKENVLSEINSKNVNRTELFAPIRKAATIKASNLVNNKTISNLYYCKSLQNIISSITNMNIENVDCKDESSINILVYNKKNDFISWHFDPNHYIGSRITVLINIINENAQKNNLSESELQYKINGEIKSIKMKPNSILIFDGTLIEHRATGIKDNENRILISFTYCNICKETLFGKILKHIKSIVLGY